MEMHNLHFILFITLIQHLYKEKKLENDDIYTLCMTKYIMPAFVKKETPPAALYAGRRLYSQGSQSEPLRRVRAARKTESLSARIRIVN